MNVKPIIRKLELRDIDSSFTRLCAYPENLFRLSIDTNVYIIDTNKEMQLTTQTLFFGNNDIISGKITKTHLLNSQTVDCSVFDNNGVEISVGFTIIDSNTIQLDMKNITIPDGIIWRIFLEGAGA